MGDKLLLRAGEFFTYAYPQWLVSPTRSGHFEPSFFSGYIGDSLGIAADEDFFYLAWVDFRNIIITRIIRRDDRTLTFTFANCKFSADKAQARRICGCFLGN
jgi:hypothetical protein